MNNSQVGRYLQTIDPDTVLDIISGELCAEMLETFFDMCETNGKEFDKNCQLFAGAVLEKVADYIRRDECAIKMFSTDSEDDWQSGVISDDNKERASACNEILGRPHAA